MKKKRILAIVCAVACLLSLGYAALAADLGSEGDPLVTLSYIVNIFKPAAVQSATQAAQSNVANYQNAMQSQLTQMSQSVNSTLQQVNALLASEGFANQVAQAAGLSATTQKSISATMWHTTSMIAKQKMTGVLGTQFLLRSGTALSGASLVDLTTGVTLASGKSIVANHLYLLPGNGVCLTASGAITVLVRGAVTIA